MIEKNTNGVATPYQQGQGSWLEEQQININNLLRILWSRWYWIVGALVLSMAAAFFYLQITPSEYKTEASLKYNSTEQSTSPNPEDLLFGGLMQNTDYLSEIYTLKSISLISRTLDTMGHHFNFYAENGLSSVNIYPKKPFSAEISYYEPDEFERGEFAYNAEQGLISYQSDKSDTELTFNLKKDSVIQVPGLTFSIGNINTLEESRLAFNFIDFLSIKEQYVKQLSIAEAEKGVPVLQASFNANNPLFTKDFLTALLTSYETYDLEQKRRSSEQTLSFINEQVDIFEELLKKSSTKLEGYKKQYDFVNIQASSQELLSNLTELQIQRNTLQIQKQNIDVLANEIAKGDDAVIGLDYTADAVLVGLVGKLNELQTRKKQLMLSYSPESSLVVNLEGEIKDVKNQIAQSVRVQQQKNKETLAFIDQKIAQINGQLGSIPSMERDLISLTSDVDVNKNIYSLLLNKKLEASITKAGVLPSFSVLDMPRVAVKVAPKSIMILAVFIILGLVIGVGSIFAKRMLNSRFSNLEALNRIENVSVLGIINHFHENVLQTKNALKELSETRNVFTETINAIRTNIAYLTMQGTRKVVSITSEVSGEGKSFVSLNIALAMTRLNKKVVIVASDLRRSKLHRYFNDPNRIGLSTYLAHPEAGIQEIIHHSGIKDLDYIVSGPVPINPSELLYQERFWGLIENLKKQYDMIIIDTAPIGLVSDSIPIIRKSDINIFVLRWLYSSEKAYELPASVAHEYGLKNMYLVVNDYKQDALYSSLYEQDTYYGGYSKYYANYGGYYGGNDYFKEDKNWWQRVMEKAGISD